MIEMKLSELAEESGLPARTIRLYITRGIVPRPLRRGKQAAYGPAHLEALRQVQKLQQEGLTLAEIAVQLARDPGADDREFIGLTAAAAPQPTPWMEFVVSEDLRVQIRSDAAPWRINRLKAAIARLADEVGPPTRDE